MLTITDIIKAKLELDRHGVPAEGREIWMSETAYMQLLTYTNLKAINNVCGFKVMTDARIDRRGYFLL